MAVTYNADRAERNLRQWTQAAIAPGLTTAEIEDLLWMARVTDSNGRLIDDVLWFGTYGHTGLRSAAAEGWRLKAAKLTNEFDASVGAGTEFKRKQKYDMCLQMAAQYDSGGSSGGLVSIPLTGDGFYDYS